MRRLIEKQFTRLFISVFASNCI